MKLGQFIKSNPKTILTLSGIGISVYLMLDFNLDVRAIAIITLLLGYITNIFVGLTTLVGLVPIIGPLIVKVFTIPFFWLLNGMGYFTSAYAIKKGYGRDIVSHRLITITLLTGIVLGYILGHLIPVR
jgi:hypothetical protein